jgi:hypothetical protein
MIDKTTEKLGCVGLFFVVFGTLLMLAVRGFAFGVGVYFAFRVLGVEI